MTRRPTALCTLGHPFRVRPHDEAGECRTIFTSTTPGTRMDEMDPDTAMVAAGVVITLVAILELYPAWKHMRER
jgi:hypothetical protein